MSSNIIPAEAVEAAARALHFFKTGAGWKDADPATVWECQEQAESILRQAAPRMMAQAWEEGKEAGMLDYYNTPNPYRKTHG